MTRIFTDLLKGSPGISALFVFKRKRVVSFEMDGTGENERG